MRILIAVLLVAAAAAAADALELLQQALQRLEALDKTGAERFLTAAIDKEPRLAQARIARGRLLAHLGQYAKAARDMECASRLGEDQWRLAAELYNSAHAYDACAHAYEQAWKRHGKLDDLVGAADARAGAGDMKGALTAYNEILRRVSGRRAVRHLAERGRIRSALGMHEEGIADLDLAIRRIPRYSRAYQLRGRIRIKQGRIQEGIADHKLALDQSTSHPSSHFILGLAYYDTGDWANAVKVLERAVRFGPEVHEYAHLYLFLARCRSGQPAKRMQAARELMKYIEGRQTSDDWFGKVGAFLTGALDEEELLAEANKGSKHLRREHLCEAHGYIAARYMIADDVPRAREHFRRALKQRVFSFVEHNTAEAELARMGR